MQKEVLREITKRTLKNARTVYRLEVISTKNLVRTINSTILAERDAIVELNKEIAAA